MTDKKLPTSLKIATAASLPLIALTVAGFLMRKCYNNMMKELDLSSNDKGLMKNAMEEYPTKRAVVRATKKQHLFSANVHQNV